MFQRFTHSQSGGASCGFKISAVGPYFLLFDYQEAFHCCLVVACSNRINMISIQCHRVGQWQVSQNLKIYSIPARGNVFPLIGITEWRDTFLLNLPGNQLLDGFYIPLTWTQLYRTSQCALYDSSRREDGLSCRYSIID